MKLSARNQIPATVLDITKGEVKPRTVSLAFEDPPVPQKKFSVHPQRALAKEYFYPAFPAANASWSKRILRGPTIRPQPLTGLGAGQCNAFAPEEWRVAGHADDNSLFHLMAEEGFAHALYKTGTLEGVSAEAFVLLGVVCVEPVAATAVTSRLLPYRSLTFPVVNASSRTHSRS